MTISGPVPTQLSGAPQNAPMTPGTYLRKRREAAGLELEDLALMLDSDPAVSARSRAELLAAVERDAAPVTEDLMRAVLRLGDTFRIDPVVWIRLIDLAEGQDIAWPKLCLACGCSEFDPCITARDGQQVACHWTVGGLCSSCDATEASMRPRPPLVPPREIMGSACFAHQGSAAA